MTEEAKTQKEEAPEPKPIGGEYTGIMATHINEQGEHVPYWAMPRKDGFQIMTPGGRGVMETFFVPQELVDKLPKVRFSEKRRKENE